ncbi:Gti1/Pac2 family-domain-containing protein, partial [Thamnocephalis sphaerospora]
METYFGYIETVQDALLVIEAARSGILRRSQHRLTDKERRSIRSGSVFVWDESEAGMRRWTDGRAWSPSRVNGCFLNYRELEHRRRGNSTSAPYAHFRYKTDGLVKRTISVTVSENRKLHLVSYFSKQDVAKSLLRCPRNDPALSEQAIPPEFYPDV